MNAGLDTRRAMGARALGRLVLCGLLLGFLLAARSGEAAGVSIRAQVILASNQGTGTDERLGPLAKQLGDSFKYSRYELLATPTGEVQLGQTWRTSLPGGRTLEVTPTAVAEGTYLLQVRVLGPKGEPLVNTSVRLPAGRPVFIGGPPNPPGVLIIALSAS